MNFNLSLTSTSLRPVFFVLPAIAATPCKCGCNWGTRLAVGRLLLSKNCHRKNFPGKNTGVDFHFLLQGIFLTQRSNLCLLSGRQNSLPLSHLGSPKTKDSHFYSCYSLTFPKQLEERACNIEDTLKISVKWMNDGMKISVKWINEVSLHIFSSNHH